MKEETLSYSDKLKDPRWQRLRLEVFQRDDFRCTRCGNGNRSLHVHHEYYRRSLDPWEYPMDALKTLCERCHEITHSPAKPTERSKYPAAEIWTLRMLFYGEETSAFIRANLKMAWITTDLINEIKLMLDPDISPQSKDEIFFACEKRFPMDFMDIANYDALESAQGTLLQLRRLYYQRELQALSKGMVGKSDEELGEMLELQGRLRSLARTSPTWETA